MTIEKEWKRKRGQIYIYKYIMYIYVAHQRIASVNVGSSRTPRGIGLYTSVFKIEHEVSVMDEVKFQEIISKISVLTHQLEKLTKEQEKEFLNLLDWMRYRVLVLNT